jgi:TonB family protein
MEAKNHNQTRVAAVVAATHAGGYQITVFPPEFERHILQELDRRFFIILIGALVLVYSMVFSLASMKYDTAKMDEQARQRYLEKFYQAQLVTEEAVAASEEKTDDTGLGGNAEEAPKTDERAQRYQGRGVAGAGGGVSAREVAEGRRAAAAARGAARRAMESQIGGTGMLGVLSAGGGSGTGDAVADVLGDAGGSGIGVGNLEDVLSGVGGLATATSSGQRTRVGSVGGGRATGSADVGELLSGIGSAGSASVGRKGTIQMTLDAARVTGTGTKAANRSGEEISRTINTHNDAVEYCYKREAKLNPNLKGDILVEFVISYDGRVGAARVTQSSLQNKTVESCIISRVRGWRFKPIGQAEGDVTVRQKYIFG